MEISENMSKIQIDEEKDSEESSVSDDSCGKYKIIIKKYLLLTKL